MSEVSATAPRSAITPSSQAKPGLRQRLFIGLALIVVVGAILYGLYWYLFLAHFVSTDNAYVNAEIAQVTPLVGGPVKSIDATNTQNVKKGQVLVTLDDADARLAVYQATAMLDTAIRKVKGYQANEQALQAQVDARVADQERAAAELSSAQAGFDRAKLDYDRRKALLSSGAVSADEVSTAEQVFASARATLAGAKAGVKVAEATRENNLGALHVNQSLISGTTVENNPEVLDARAKLDKAQLDLDRTVIRAPVDGIVAQRQVQIGQHVDQGVSLMTVVPIDQIYVDANFKEGQLTDVRPGQKAELTSDLYGSSVVYHGVVSGLAGGTGSAFAIIPAQNATGNWIKVVQRIPVRISLDPQELAAHPLRVGLSMNASIDIASKAGS